MCLHLGRMELLHKALAIAQKALAFTLLFQILLPWLLSQLFHTELVLLKFNMIYTLSTLALFPFASLHWLFLLTTKIQSSSNIASRKTSPCMPNSNIDWLNYLLSCVPGHFVVELLCSIALKSL